MNIRKSLVVGVICLLILTSVPMVSGDNTQLVNSEVLIDNPSGIFDNLLIKAHGSYLMEMFFVLLGDPVYLVETRITNFHDESITLDRHVTIIATRENRILDEFDDDLPFKLQPGKIVITKYLDQFDWKYYDYTFGPFDFIWNIYIPEADESITLVFHGFVFGIGTIIFNPKGEVIG